MATSDADGNGETGTRRNTANGDSLLFSLLRTRRRKRPTKKDLSPQELLEYVERVKARGEHPELAPSMFLWKDFGEGWGTRC